MAIHPPVRRALLLASFTAILALASPRITAEPTPSGVMALVVQPRPRGAPTGSVFAKQIGDLPAHERQQRAVRELIRGNMPAFLRALKPVATRWDPGDGAPLTATFWVMPDYLAVGSDWDFLRIPLDMFSATEVANHFGYLLPTPKMVDAIYAQAEVHLVPEPMTPGPQMRSVAYYLQHRKLIEDQRGELPPGALTAGHKKDLVLTDRLATHPDRIAIYGWHRPDGEPIQPLSLWHGARYADYSHGIRLIHPVVWIDGEPTYLQDALESPQLAGLFTDEIPMHGVTELMHPERHQPPAR